MKCPKCGYLGFEAVERCRNCGYDFSLDAPSDPTSRSPRHETTPPTTLARRPLADRAAADVGAGSIAFGAADPTPCRGGRWRRRPRPEPWPRPRDLPLFGPPIPTTSRSSRERRRRGRRSRCAAATPEVSEAARGAPRSGEPRPRARSRATRAARRDVPRGRPSADTLAPTKKRRMRASARGCSPSSIDC
jgi:hypothetical protein